MIAHIIPYSGVVRDPPPYGPARAAADLRAAPADGKPEQPAGLKGRHGPVRVPLHAAPRRQGAGVDPGVVSRSAGARWLRGTLLLPDARPAGARCRWQCV